MNGMMIHMVFTTEGYTGLRHGLLNTRPYFLHFRSQF